VARQIIVEILGDSKKFTGAVDSAASSGGKFNNVLKGIGQGLGISTFNVFQQGMGMVVDQIGNAITNASNLQQSIGAVDQVFGDSAGKITDWSNKAADAAGLSRNAVNEAAASMGAQLTGMGFSTDQAADSVINIQQRAADMAATFGGTTAEAIAAVGSLMRGERDPIEKYGVSLKQSDINARLAAEGLDGLTGEARKQAEAQVALNMFMEQTNKTQGQFARESDSMAGAQQRASAKFENASAKLGNVLLPILANVMGFIADVAIPAIENFGSTVGTIFHNVTTTVSDVIRNVRQTLNNIVTFIGDLPGRIGRAASGMWDGIWSAFKGAVNSIIRAWNSLSFTVPRVDVGPIHFGGFQLGTPNIPYLHSGGIVPGVPGTDVLTMLQAGERVIPRNAVGNGGGGGITINIGSFVGSDHDIEKFADRLAMRLRLSGVTS
jgi:hypothetical protein